MFSLVEIKPGRRTPDQVVRYPRLWNMMKEERSAIVRRISYFAADISLLHDDHDLQGKLGNTSMLEFDSTEALKLGLVSIGDESEGVEKAERSLGAELVFESLDSRAGGLLGGRGKGSSRGDKGGGDDGLHVADRSILVDENMRRSRCTLRKRIRSKIRFKHRVPI
jgi:hypothetical protein